jgi:hypothetical protein
MGHPELPEVNRSRVYFNAGALLIDLSLIRQRLPEMRIALAALQETAYRDQDLLFSLMIFMSLISFGMLAALAHTLHSSDDRNNTWPQGG